MAARISSSDLTGFAAALLARTGLDSEKSAVVAGILVEGDLLGHTTHGLALLPAYLGDIEKGAMTVAGEPRVLADLPSAVAWDGRRLPGPWLVVRALDLAAGRATKNGTCTVVIRRSHHIACLAAYLRRMTDQGLMVLLSCSDPGMSSVAPHGGRRAVFTPNPIAAAWPTEGDPVILDVSMSITTNAFTNRLHTEKRMMPGEWAIDSRGEPSADPADIFTDPPGALLPMGGLDHGHKGYALGLLVEAMTGGLAGHGRANPKEGWGASVFIEVFDPALFGGAEGFIRETTRVAEACRGTPPRRGFDRVRMPGEAGLRRRAEQIAHGIELRPETWAALTPWAGKLGVAVPVQFSPA